MIGNRRIRVSRLQGKFATNGKPRVSDYELKTVGTIVRVSRTYSHVKDFPKTGKSHPVLVWTGTIAGGGSSVYTPVKNKEQV